jgi:hypothetical protein
MNNPTTSIINNIASLRAFGKKHNLTFDEKFKYCISDAYKDDKGDYIQSYYYYDNNVYSLKYFDGCFNPFLVIHNDRENFCVITKENSTQVEAIFKVGKSKSTKDALIKRYGDNFSML